MESQDFFVALKREGEAFAKACSADLTAAIPSCPGWDTSKLMNHLGRVHRWAAEAVADEKGEAPKGFPPSPDAVSVEWYLHELNSLIDSLQSVDLEAARWTFSPAHHQAWFWLRRQALETAIHRWDAQDADSKEPSPIESALAVEGIEEYLVVFAPMSIGRAQPGFDLGGTLHLHAADHDGEWLLTTRESQLSVERTHQKATAAIQAPASDLFLWLWGRVGAENLTVFGDPSVLTQWSSLGSP